MTKKTPVKSTNTGEQQSQIIDKPTLNLELGRIKAKANNFWIAIAFLLAFTICFITYSICNAVVNVTNQYFKNLTEIRIKSEN